MLNPSSPVTPTDALRSLHATLMALSCVDRVLVDHDRGLRFLRVIVDGCHHVVAVLYPLAWVVVLVDDGRIARPLGDLTHAAVCAAADALGMTLIHGVYKPCRRFVADPTRRLPDQTHLVRECELTAATLSVEAAQVRRLMAAAAGMAVPTGVALMIGAPLHVGTLTFPLCEAEKREYERLHGEEDLPIENFRWW